MPRNSFRVSESSETELTFPVEGDGDDDEGVKNPGCYFTYVNGFIAVLAAILLAVVVGLIVGLAHPAIRVDHTCPTVPPTPDPETEWQRCVNMSWERGDCLPGLVCTTQRPTVTSPTTPPTSPTTTVGPTNIRLPDTLTPTHYNLLLQPDIYSSDPSNFSFTGTVEIYFRCKKKTSEIILHSKKLDTPKNLMTLGEVDGSKIDIGDVSYDPVSEFLTIRVGSELVVATEYSLVVQFRGPLTKDLTGLYLSTYTFGDDIRYLMTSHLQATDARKVFPCFDEPALKATFNVTIDRKDGYIAMSNTQVYKTEKRKNGWQRDYFSSTPPMSTYILAFIVSDFDCVPSATTDNKKVEICARPNVMNQTKFAASIAGRMQQFYEQYHNISFPLPKTGHIGVPDFGSGAMENWGLIIYRETALLYDPATSTAEARQRVAVVIGHELAHMWFGNLVTPLWWDDLWLNEGFASYLETLGVDDVMPDWQIYNNVLRDDLLPAMDMDALMTSHPVYLPVENPAQISELFDTITYSKGASIIRMMKFFLGEDTFRWGLANYLNDRKFSAANHTDLFYFMTKQAEKDGNPIDVGSVMRTWILQKGFPLVTVRYDGKSGQVTLAQKHFLLSASNDVDYNPRWEIPISLVKGPKGDWDSPITGWLTEESDSLDIGKGADWIIGNVKFQYFYRVNYDESNWKALSNQLRSNHSKIDVANRIQIIDDSFNLGRAGETSPTLALHICKYLQKEREYLPWVGADRGFAYLSAMLDLTPDYGLLKNYARSLLNDVYLELGWEDNVTQPHLQRLLRATVLNMACDYGLRDCPRTASNMYKKWMDNGTSIPSGVQPLVFCQGIRMGLEEEWNFAFNRYKQSNSGAEKKTLLIALACTRENWILRRYLDLALEEKEIKRQDFRIVPVAVASNPLGRRLAWDFFVTNWETLFDRFGDGTFTLSDLVEGITKTFSTQQELDELEDFVRSHPNQGTAHAAFQNAVETTKINLEWRRKNEKLIFDWLKNVSM